MLRIFAPFNSSAESCASETSSVSTPVKNNGERGTHSDDEKGIDNSTPSMKSKQQEGEAFTNEPKENNNGQLPVADPAMDVSILVSPMKPSKSMESLVQLVDPEEMKGDIEQGNFTPLEAMKNLQTSHRLFVQGKQKHHHHHRHHSKLSIKRHNNHAVRPKLWNGMKIKTEEESTAHVLLGMSSSSGTKETKYTSNIITGGNNGHVHSIFQDFNVNAIPGLPPSPPPSLPFIMDGKKGGRKQNGGKTKSSIGPDNNSWKKSEEVGFVQSKPYSLRDKKGSKKKKKKQPSPPLQFRAGLDVKEDVLKFAIDVIHEKHRVVYNPRSFILACEEVLSEHDDELDVAELEYIVEALALIMRVQYPCHALHAILVLRFYCSAHKSLCESYQAQEAAMTSSLWAIKRFQNNPRVLEKALIIIDDFLVEETVYGASDKFAAFCMQGGVELLMKVEKTIHKELRGKVEQILCDTWTTALEYVAMEDRGYETASDDDLVRVHCRLTICRLGDRFRD